MTDKLLDITCKFKCSAATVGAGIFTPIQPPLKGNESGKILLTTSTTIPPGPTTCNNFLIEGVPQPCKLALGPWQNSSNKIKLCGQPVLTKKSTAMCTAFGGTLKPVSAVSKSGVNSGKEVSSVANIPIAAIAPLGIQAAEPLFSLAKTVAAENGVAKPVPVAQGDKGGPTNVAENTDASGQQKHEEKDASCNYEECKERDNCPYYNLTFPYYVRDAAELGRYFTNKNAEQPWKSDFEALKRDIEAGQKKIKGKWGFERHHLICVYQVFQAHRGEDKNNPDDLLFGPLVKLAKFCGYDINRPENGILLPSNYKPEVITESGVQPLFSEMASEAKAAAAYDVMEIMKRQWHKGGHSYKLERDSLRKFKEQVFLQKNLEDYQGSGRLKVDMEEGLAEFQSPELFPIYVNLLKAKLRKLQKKYGNIKCYKKWAEKSYKGEKNKDRLIRELNELAQEVKSYLERFAKDPRLSYPYYVSEVAIKYAFDLPRTIKLVVIYNDKEGRPSAARFRIERLKRDAYSVKAVVSASMVLDNSREKFIEFCENSMYFWISPSVNFRLPFSLDKEPYGAVKTSELPEGITVSELEKYLTEKGHELLVFAENREFNYLGVNSAIMQRLLQET